MRLLRRLDLPARERCEILDVGCGDALFFPELRELGRVRGIEIDRSLLTDDGPDRASVHTLPLGDPAYAGWAFDLIVSLDVVEHIEDDAWAVAEMVGMLRPGGWLVMTVPAFMSLWDHHDEINHHHRRYRAAEFASLVRPPARVVETRYLFHSLFPAKWVVARMNRGRGEKAEQFGVPPAPANALATAWCDWEERLLGWARVPVGTSVLVVARRD